MPVIATVSGSFRRHMASIEFAVRELQESGVRVLSPADPRVVDAIGEFLFVASDRHRSIRLVQDRHLAAIRSSHFLWLVCPDGYVGPSAALEIGFALAHQKPVFALHLPRDQTLRQYVRVVESIPEAICLSKTRPHHEITEGLLLLDPLDAARRVQFHTERIVSEMDTGGLDGKVAKIRKDHEAIQRIIALPSSLPESIE